MSTQSESYSQFTNPSKIRYSSQKSWSNGMQRRILANNQTDPFDNLVSISQGELRKAFFDGYGNCYHSGDRSRLNFRINAYNALLSFRTKWKTTGLTNLSLRLRSRIDELAPEANRFGGYVAVITTTQIKWYKLNYLSGIYTALNPATTTITPSLVDGEDIGIKFYLYSNVANTNANLHVKISRNEAGFKPIGTSVDATPASHVLDKKLYYNLSYAHIKLNGTAKDMQYRDLKIWDLGNDYYQRAINEKGTVVKSTRLLFNMTNMVKSLTTRFNINYE